MRDSGRLDLYTKQHNNHFLHLEVVLRDTAVLQDSSSPQHSMVGDRRWRHSCYKGRRSQWY